VQSLLLPRADIQRKQAALLARPNQKNARRIGHEPPSPTLHAPVFIFELHNFCMGGQSKATGQAKEYVARAASQAASFASSALSGIVELSLDPHTPPEQKLMEMQPYFKGLDACSQLIDTREIPRAMQRVCDNLSEKAADALEDSLDADWDGRIDAARHAMVPHAVTLGMMAAKDALELRGEQREARIMERLRRLGQALSAGPYADGEILDVYGMLGLGRPDFYAARAKEKIPAPKHSHRPPYAAHRSPGRVSVPGQGKPSAPAAQVPKTIIYPVPHPNTAVPTTAPATAQPPGHHAAGPSQSSSHHVVVRGIGLNEAMDELVGGDKGALADAKELVGRNQINLSGMTYAGEGGRVCVKAGMVYKIGEQLLLKNVPLSPAAVRKYGLGPADGADAGQPAKHDAGPEYTKGPIGPARAVRALLKKYVQAENILDELLQGLGTHPEAMKLMHNIRNKGPYVHMPDIVALEAIALHMAEGLGVKIPRQDMDRGKPEGYDPSKWHELGPILHDNGAKWDGGLREALLKEGYITEYQGRPMVLNGHDAAARERIDNYLDLMAALR